MTKSRIDRLHDLAVLREAVNDAKRQLLVMDDEYLFREADILLQGIQDHIDGALVMISDLQKVLRGE